MIACSYIQRSWTALGLSMAFVVAQSSPSSAQTGRFGPDNPWFRHFEATCRTPDGVQPMCEGGILGAYAAAAGTEEITCDFEAFWKARDTQFDSKVFPVLPWQNGVEALVGLEGVCAPNRYVIGNDRDGESRVALTSCGDNDNGPPWQECTVAWLGCKGKGAGSLTIYDGAVVLQALRFGDQETMPVIEFRVNSAIVRVVVWSVEADFTELDQTWETTLRFPEGGELFQALSETAASFSATVAGIAFPLTPRTDDRLALVSYAIGCNSLAAEEAGQDALRKALEEFNRPTDIGFGK